MKGQKGFTLIELLVVIAIIGILAVLVLANLNSSRQKARDGRRKSDLRNIQTALELFYTDEAEYADDIYDAAVFTNEYMANVPVDPLNDANYEYQSVETGGNANQAYKLRSQAENENDAEAQDGFFVKCGGDFGNDDAVFTIPGDC